VSARPARLPDLGCEPSITIALDGGDRNSGRGILARVPCYEWDGASRRAPVDEIADTFSRRLLPSLAETGPTREGRSSPGDAGSRSPSCWALSMHRRSDQHAVFCRSALIAAVRSMAFRSSYGRWGQRFCGCSADRGGIDPQAIRRVRADFHRLCRRFRVVGDRDGATIAR
jgi:hypothetical protein